MNNIRLTFLGTGTSTGVPVIGCGCAACRSVDPRDNRLRCAALVEFKDSNLSIAIDAGPDFRQQMIESRTTKLDAILLTHEHYDHVGGLDDVRGLNYSMRRDVNIYASERVAAIVQKNLHYVFSPNPYPGSPQINLHKFSASPFKIGSVEVLPLPIMHGKLPIHGFRMGPLAYITDASHVPDSTIDFLKGVKVLVINALRVNPHPSHMSTGEAIRIAERVGAETTYFTHISHQLGLHKKVDASLPAGTHLAYDTLSIEI